MAKILIVDDEARILLLLQSLLKANGYDTVTAKDGQTALSLLKAESPDLVITDLRMSPMDGMTLSARSRRSTPPSPSSFSPPTLLSKPPLRP
jgi:CheY-like chemotaxis protein